MLYTYAKELENEISNMLNNSDLMKE